MAAYYNEHEPFAAQWLRNLIAAGHIADGDVDERDIMDVEPVELFGYDQCHFFAGIGVWSHALRRAGWVDDRPVWTGSCPCQPFSTAGAGLGFADERHLWPYWHHLISECRPSILFGEQVSGSRTGAWLDLVQDDMEGLDYAFGAIPFAAGGIGAPHIRERIYWVADALRAAGRQDARGAFGDEAADWRAGRDGGGAHRDNRPASDGEDDRAGPLHGFWRDADWLLCRDGKWRPVEPGTFPLAHGAPSRVGRLRTYGNAIVAPAAQAFIEAYLET